MFFSYLKRQIACFGILEKKVMSDIQQLLREEARIKGSLMQIEKSIQHKEIKYLRVEWKEGNIRTGLTLGQQEVNKHSFKPAHNISTINQIFSLSSLTSPAFGHLTQDIDQASISQSQSTKRVKIAKSKYKHKKIIKISRKIPKKKPNH